MSKTQRRKKGPIPQHVTHDYVKVGVRIKEHYYIYYWEWLPISEEDQKIAIAKYYSDTGIGRKWPVPSWYAKMLNNDYRTKARHEMQKNQLMERLGRI
jgi:hypothetical protein